MRNDNPCRAPERRVRPRIGIDDALGGIDGGAVVLHLIHVVGSRSQYRGGLFVLRERIGKLERACDRIALDLVLVFGCRAGGLELLAVCVDRGVTRVCRLGMARVLVGRALVLLRRLAEVLVLQEKVRELVVD